MRKHILFWLLVNWIGWIYAESVEKEIPQLLATLDSILGVSPTFCTKVTLR